MDEVEEVSPPSDAAPARGPASDTAPPYFPFRTLTNLLVRMEAEGIPRRLDRGYLKNMAGGSIAQFITGLRALGLIDAEERPQLGLRSLVAASDKRPEAIAEILRNRYSWAIQLGSEGATQQELDEAFRERGVSGSTLRKAVAFYLQAAKYANVPLSAFFREPRVTAEGTPRRTSRRRTPRDQGDSTGATVGGGVVENPPPPPPPSGTDVQQMRREYFDLLKKKADEQADPDAALFDRIERLLDLGGEGK